jgi:hypothetical protein
VGYLEKVPRVEWTTSPQDNDDDALDSWGTL